MSDTDQSLKERVDDAIDVVNDSGLEPVSLTMTQWDLFRFTEELRAAGITWPPSHPYWTWVTKYRGLDVLAHAIPYKTTELVIGVTGHG